MNKVQSPWDVLARGRSFYSSSRYLAYAAARSPEVTLIEATADCSLIAGVPAWHTTGGGHPFLEPAHVLADVGLVPSRYLVLGSPWAFFGEFLSSSSRSEQALISAVRNRQRSTESTAALGLYIDDESGRRLAAATSRQPLLLNFDAVLDVPASFSEYLNQLSSKRRTNVRREISAFHEAGLKVDIEQIQYCVQDLSMLIVASEERQGICTDVDKVCRNLLIQAEYFPDAVRVFTARDGAGKLRGGVVAHLDDNAVHMRLAGIDRTCGGDAFEYFNLVFYAPLRYAMETRRTQISLGMEAFQAKLLRGARLEPRWAVDLSTIRMWDDHVAEIWNKQMLGRLDDLIRCSSNTANVALRSDLEAHLASFMKE